MTGQPFCYKRAVLYSGGFLQNDVGVSLGSALFCALAQGALEIGEAVRRLRVEVTGLHQTQFAKMCKISVRTLVHIEHGEGNQTLKSLNAVFRPFGLKMGVVRVRRDLG